jgi:hypothetical protein
MTYEEIDAEWESLVAETSRLLPLVCKAGVIAHMQDAASLPIRARCLHCGGLLKATVLNLGHQGSTPLISRPCGRSKNFFRVS